MKSVASRVTYEVRPFRDDDSNQVLDLLTLALGPGMVGERTSAFFRWKHVHTPFGGSFMLVADRGGQLIGFRSFMRWRFLAPGGEVRAVSPVDTATHPDFQRLGVFSRLTQTALEAFRDETDLVFNTPNANSAPGYLKMGWKRVGRVPVTMQICRPLHFAMRSLVGRSVTHGSDLPPPIHAETAASVLRTEGGHIAEFLADIDVPSDRIRTRRTLDYLQWRYADAPHLDYRAVTEHGEGRLRGLAIFRVRPCGPLWETWVVELIVPPGERETARSLLRHIRRAAPVDNLRGIFPKRTSAAHAAWRQGFIRSRFGILLFANPLRGAVQPDPTLMDSWALSLGDVEIF
jgi:GNAT superfamily N-acetyltransferase